MRLSLLQEDKRELDAFTTEFVSLVINYTAYRGVLLQVWNIILHVVRWSCLCISVIKLTDVFLHLAIVAQETQGISQLASVLAASREVPSSGSSVFSVEFADEIVGAESLTSIAWRMCRN